MDYRSGTATHDPFAAGSAPELPPNNAEQLGRLLASTMRELESVTRSPATEARYQYLQRLGLDLQGRLAIVWNNPPAWMGVHRQILELRQGVQALRAAPFRVGDTRQGIPTPAPRLAGLAGLLGGTTAPGRRVGIGASVVVLAAVAGVAWTMSRSSDLRGGLGNPHGLKLNLKNPKYPNARKAR